MDDKTQKHPFKPVYDEHSRVLILGSFPPLHTSQLVSATSHFAKGRILLCGQLKPLLENFRHAFLRAKVSGQIKGRENRLFKGTKNRPL